MLSARLVKIIEEHAEDMSRSLITRLRSDGRVATLVRASQDDLEQRADDVFHNLGRCLDDKSEEAIAHAWDRRLMSVDAAGRFLTQRERPRLALIRPALAEGHLHLDAPGRPSLRIPLESDRPPARRVQVWNDVCEAWDEGPPAAAWLGAHLGHPAHLVRMTDDWERPVDPDHAPRPARTGFADAFPLLVCEASLVELNRRLGAA